MTQPSRRTPPTSSQANLSATSSRGQVDKNTKSTSSSSSTSKTGDKKPAGKAGHPPTEDNTKSTSSTSSTSKTSAKKPAGKAGHPPTEDNTKSTSSTSKTGAKKPTGKAGHPPAKDNTKLYIGVGGGLLLLLIVIGCYMGGDKEAAPVQAVAAPTKVAPYDELADYHRMSISERKKVYLEGCANDLKIEEAMKSFPSAKDSDPREQKRRLMARAAKEKTIRSNFERELMNKYHIKTEKSFSQINADGVDNHWK